KEETPQKSIPSFRTSTIRLPPARTSCRSWCRPWSSAVRSARSPTPFAKYSENINDRPPHLLLLLRRRIRRTQRFIQFLVNIQQELAIIAQLVYQFLYFLAKYKDLFFQVDDHPLLFFQLSLGICLLFF